jgi:hypothetical protein
MSNEANNVREEEEWVILRGVLMLIPMRKDMSQKRWEKQHFELVATGLTEEQAKAIVSIANSAE